MTHPVLIAVVLVCLFVIGCGSEGPAAPSNPNESVNDLSSPVRGVSNRTLWGLWDIGIRKTTGEYEIIPIRNTQFHLNALSFLEPPALTGLTIDNGTIVIDQVENYVAVDVILNHPFPGMDQYSGFDVRGIVMLPGSYMPYSDITLIRPGAGDPRLLNPDGWTRWWNPKEFPGAGLFGFQQGLIGGKGGAGVFTCTMNAYKYFADGLNADDDVLGLPPDGRGVFRAGASNRRYYEISFGDDPGDWLRFQYAVDASWDIPATMKNPDVPDDFPPSANAPEGYAVVVDEIDNTLWWLEGIGTGGELSLSIDVYTWRPDAIDRVVFDAPGIIGSPVEVEVVVGSGGGPDDPVYSTYTVDIEPDALTTDGLKECLVIVESNEDYSQDGLTIFFGPTGTPVSGYYPCNIDVSWVPPLEWQLVTAKLLPTQPETVLKEMSVVGLGDYEGVYFFGDEYKLYRYDLEYISAVQVSTLAGFFGYSELDLYGAPETIGRFDLCPFGQFVASSISAAPSPTFLGGLKRDYVYFFNEVYSISGQLPMQIGIPDPSMGFFKFTDVAANWATDVQDAKIYWFHVDDPDETTEPDPAITVILGVYQYAFTGNPFSGDIDYISGSLVPSGSENGEIDIASVDRLAVDDDPQGVTGSTDLITWFLETSPSALECFSVVSSDDSGDLNQHLTTVTDFHATPRDIVVIPTHKGGYGTHNWVVVLEEGSGEWSVETFDQFGNKRTCLYDIPGYPACIDVDPERYRIHIWFSLEIAGPIYASVFELAIG